MKTNKSLLAIDLIVLMGVMYFSAGVHAHPTYTDDVGKIINNNCLICHRPGGIGPMSFAGYEQVRPWAPLIKMKVASRDCLLYTSPSPRDRTRSRMPSSA